MINYTDHFIYNTTNSQSQKTPPQHMASPFPPANLREQTTTSHNSDIDWLDVHLQTSQTHSTQSLNHILEISHKNHDPDWWWCYRHLRPLDDLESPVSQTLSKRMQI